MRSDRKCGVEVDHSERWGGVREEGKENGDRHELCGGASHMAPGEKRCCWCARVSWSLGVEVEAEKERETRWECGGILKRRGEVNRVKRIEGARQSCDCLCGRKVSGWTLAHRCGLQRGADLGSGLLSTSGQ